MSMFDLLSEIPAADAEAILFGEPTMVEPTHSDEDEAYYVNEILPGWHDEAEADRERDDYDPDFGFMDDFDGREADRAADRWERNFWGD